MLDTRKMSLLELYQHQAKPIYELDADGWKAARVLDRRKSEWLKANPEKDSSDWYDTWYPGGHRAFMIGMALSLTV